MSGMRTDRSHSVSRIAGRSRRVSPESTRVYTVVIILGRLIVPRCDLGMMMMGSWDILVILGLDGLVGWDRHTFVMILS